MPSRTLFFANLLMVIIPTAFWFAFVIPALFDYYGPCWWVVFLGGFFEIQSVLNACICCFKDPGRIPKAPVDLKLREFYEKQYQQEQEKQLVKVSVSTSTTSSTTPKKNQELAPFPKATFDDLYPLEGDGPKKTVLINNIEVSIKYCKSCNVWKPPRSTHCRKCNSCIEEFDHHCPWVGNCVGKRTYSYFAMFLHMTVGLLVVVFVSSITVIVKTWTDDGDSFGNAMKEQIVAFLLAIYTGIVFLSVGGLWAFHVYLMFLGITTNEQITFKYGGRRPFDQGYLVNFFSGSFQFYRPRWGVKSARTWAGSGFCDHDYLLDQEDDERVPLWENPETETETETETGP